MFSKSIKNPSEYIPRSEILHTLLRGFDLDEIFYPEIIRDIKSSTKNMRMLEGTSVLFLLGSILYALIELYLHGLPLKKFWLLVSAALLSGASYPILQTMSNELGTDQIILKSRNKVLAREFLDYFVAFKNSTYDTAKQNSSSGLVSIGKLHRADGGLLCILGKSKDRHAIRKFNLGWGELHFPRVELILPKTLQTTSHSQEESLSGEDINIDLYQTEINQYTTVNMQLVDITVASQADPKKEEDFTPSAFTKLVREAERVGQNITTIDGLKKLARSKSQEYRDIFDRTETLFLKRPLSESKTKIIERGFAIIDTIAKTGKTSWVDNDPVQRNGKSWPVKKTMYAEFSNSENKAFSRLLREHLKAEKN